MLNRKLQKTEQIKNSGNKSDRVIIKNDGKIVRIVRNGK